MRSKAERYRDLRKAVQKLGSLDKKEISTNELIKTLDPIWRALLRVRAGMLKAMAEKYGLDSIRDVPSIEFYSMYCQIHNPMKEGETCQACLSKFDEEFEMCPFCDERKLRKKSNDNGITLDFEFADGTPDWNIKVDTKDMLWEKEDNTPEIKPITERDDIQGPKGPKRTYSRRRDSLSKSTIKMKRWWRKREFCKMFPFTPKALRNYPIQDLKTIAACLPEYEHLYVAPMNYKELIRYILGYQPDGPIDPGEPPYHVEVPVNHNETVLEEGNE